MYSVNMPSKESFDLSSYKMGYNGVIITLDKKGNSIGYIVYSGVEFNDPVLVFKSNNFITDDDLVYDTFEELLKDNPKIESLKLIKFD